VNAQHQGIGMTSRRTRNRLIERLKEKGITNIDVLDVMRDLPRHIFMDEALASRAYEDTALPIGYGQTISQPYIVALMTEALLADNHPKKVLEIGTGCGYQTAILAKLVPEVYSVERIQGLHKQAHSRMRDLQLFNVRLRYGDGFKGWPEKGPYDAIITTAAPEQIPQELINQLAEGGRLIIPVGGQGQQILNKFTRRGDDVIQEQLCSVSFVPMLSETS